MHRGEDRRQDEQPDDDHPRDQRAVAVPRPERAGARGATTSPPGGIRLGDGAHARDARPEVDPRVEEGVDDVGEDADDDDEEGDEERHPLHRGEVAGEDRVDHQRAEAGQGEDALDDERAADEVAEVDPDDRHRRDGGVAQDVTAQQRDAGGALGLRGADVVGLQDGDHRGAQAADDGGAHGDREGEGRQEEVVEVLRGRLAVAADREEAQPHAEHEDEHDARPRTAACPDRAG